MMKRKNRIKKLFIVTASLASMTSLALSTISCGSSSGLSTEDGFYVAQYGSKELKELYYTGVAKNLYKFSGADDRKIDVADSVTSNDYLNMKEYLLLNDLWATANSSKNKNYSGSDLSELIITTRDYSDYKTEFKTALNFLIRNDLHDILNGKATNSSGVTITKKQTIEIMNIYYNLSQDERIKINKEMIDMYFLNSEHSYNSLYSNDYLVQYIQEYRPSMLWAITNTKDNVIDPLSKIGDNLNTVKTTTPNDFLKTWNGQFGIREGDKTNNTNSFINTETVNYKYQRSSLGVLPMLGSNNPEYSNMYNFQGMKFTSDTLADDASTLSVFGYNRQQQEKKNPDIYQDGIVVTKDSNKNSVYVHGKIKGLNIYYAKNFVNNYAAPSEGLPFGQYSLPTNITSDKTSILRNYIELQLISKMETSALSFYQDRYYIDVTNDDVKKVQPSGTGK